MIIFTITSLLPYLVLSKTNCDKNSNVKLSELKTDVEKIGNGFENLAFDVMQKVMDDLQPYAVNGDYYVSSESVSKETTTQNPTTKKILNNFLENTTQAYTTKKSVKSDKDVENLIATESSIANSIESVQTRHKRSVDENVISNNFLESPIKSESSNYNNTLCPTKTLEEQHLERQHIEDLKEEVKKLYDLVILLKDQQKIMSLLDLEAKNLDSDLATRFDPKDLLKILNRVNNKDSAVSTKSFGQLERTNEKKTTHEELEKIKFDLRTAVEALNKTKEILAMERMKEINLENQMEDQRIELNFLKVMVQKLYENNAGTHPKKGNSSSANEVLGATVHLPKELPTKTNKLNEGSKKIKVHGTTTTTESTNEDGNVQKARSSELDDLDRLLHEIHKPKKDDLESKMFELEREIDKKKKDEDHKKRLAMLKIFLEQQQKKEENTKNLPDDESVMVKRLLLAIKNANKPQNRVIDDDVELELQRLQIAIDNLRPKDEWDPRQEKKDGQLEKILSRLLNQQSKNEDISANAANKSPQLSPKQIVDLRRQLDELNYNNMKGVGGNMFSAPNAYGYGPQFADLYGRGPSSQFFSGGFSNFPPSYSSYQPTSRIVTNHGGMFNPSNSPFGGYYPSADVKNYNNFGPNPNFRSLPPNEMNPGFNPYRGSPNYNQNLNGLGPNNVEIHQFGGSEAHRISKPLPYSQAVTGGQSTIQEETKTQFFPAPQPIVHEKPSSDAVYIQSNVAGSSASQSGQYPQENTGNVDYRYQKIEELKSQVDGLQSIINNLNKPDYTQRPEDKETVANLEKQINELKDVIHGMTQDTTPNQHTYVQNVPTYDQNTPQQNYQKVFRRRKSVEDNQIDLDENSELYDQVVSKLKQIIFDNKTGTEEGRSSYYEDIQRRIEDLKSQLEVHTRRRGIGQERHFDPINPTSVFQNPYQALYDHYGVHPQTTSSKLFKTDLVQSKKNDIFTSIVIKILDKVLTATPAVLQKLFGYGLTQLSNFGDTNTYGDQYGGYNAPYGSQNNVLGLFKSLGFFGYGPLIILKIIDGFATFVNILKKNKFFKNFLLPALVLLLVAGSILFLIWWLQPNEDQVSIGQAVGSGYNNNYYGKNYEQYSNNKYYQNSGYGNDGGYGPGKSYNNPVYSRSYFENGP